MVFACPAFDIRQSLTNTSLTNTFEGGQRATQGWCQVVGSLVLNASDRRGPLAHERHRSNGGQKGQKGLRPRGRHRPAIRGRGWRRRSWRRVEGGLCRL